MVMPCCARPFEDVMSVQPYDDSPFTLARQGCLMVLNVARWV